MDQSLRTGFYSVATGYNTDQRCHTSNATKPRVCLDALRAGTEETCGRRGRRLGIRCLAHLRRHSGLLEL